MLKSLSEMKNLGMVNYSKVSPIRDSVVDLFIKNVDLFDTFDTPVNVLFINNFSQNIRRFQNVFEHYSMSQNIFFSCKSNKSCALLEKASELDCGIEVSSYYELLDALKYTNKIIASGPAKNDRYLKLSIDNNIVISIDDIEELKNIIKYNKTVHILIRLSNILNKISRFGVNISQIGQCLKLIKHSKIILDGFSFHFVFCFISIES